MKRGLLIGLVVFGWLAVAGCVAAAVLSLIHGDMSTAALEIIVASVAASSCIGIKIPEANE